MNATLQRIDRKQDYENLDEEPSANFWVSRSWIKDQLFTPGGLCILALVILCLGFAILGSDRLNQSLAGRERLKMAQIPSLDSSVLGGTREAAPTLPGNSSAKAGVTSEDTESQTKIPSAFGKASPKTGVTVEDFDSQTRIPSAFGKASLLPAPLIDEPVSPVLSQPQHPNVYTIPVPGTSETRLKTIVNQ